MKSLPRASNCLACASSSRLLYRSLPACTKPSAVSSVRHIFTSSSATSAPSTASLRTSSHRGSASGNRTYFTALACGLVGYGLALVFPPSLYKLLYPTPVPLNPSTQSLAGAAAAKIIEEQLQQLDIVKQLREEWLNPEEAQKTPNTTSLEQEQISRPRKWKETRPYSNIPAEKKRHSLTHASLRGPGMFAVPPILFSSTDEKESIAILHVGNALCGHNGIVHGGLLATILDEATARPVGRSLDYQLCCPYLHVLTRYLWILMFSYSRLSLHCRIRLE